MFLELKVWSKCSVAYKYLIESLLSMYIFSLTKKRTVLNFYVSFIQMESNMNQKSRKKNCPKLICMSLSEKKYLIPYNPVRILGPTDF